jgi:hypothetical protein
MEIGGIQFASDREVPFSVPAERRVMVAAVFGEGLQVPGGVGEFEAVLTYP